MTEQTKPQADAIALDCSSFMDVAELIHSELDRIEGEAGQQGQLYQDAGAEVDYAVHEIAGLLDGALRVRVRLGDELFRFSSHSQWVNKAQSWFRGVRRGYVCIDRKGRICQAGKEFMRARDEDSFPIIVYSID